MNYRRLLLIADLGGDPRAALNAIRRVAPKTERLVILARLPARNFAWFSGEAPRDQHETAHAALEALRGAAAGTAPEVEVRLAPDLTTEALDELATASQIDLLVAGSLSFSSLPIVAELRKRRALAVLWVPATTGPESSHPLTELTCISLGRHASASIAAFLRDHGDPSQKVTVLLLAGQLPAELAAALEVAGIRAAVELAAPTGWSPRRWLDERLLENPIDLLVFARFPVALLLNARWRAPSLLLPFVAAAWRPLKRRIDAPDLVDDGEPLRARLEYAVGVGRRTAIPDQEVAFVSGGRIVAVVSTHDGEAVLPADCRADSYGVFRSEGIDPASDPLLAVEQRVTVVRPGSSPLVVFDANLPDEELSALGELAARFELLAVRIRATASCRSLRERLQAAGFPPRVVDASLVLDEGSALDVPEAVDAVRLARVGAKLRGAGFPVVAIVYRGADRPDVHSFAALRAHELAAAVLPPAPSVARPASLADRLEATTGAPLLAGNRIEVELDNGKARRWLLAAIEAGQRRIHLQVYMAADDEIGRQVEGALVKAAERNVSVRLLVDSLHGLHGSLGVRNPLLERLAARPGIELRVCRPITGLPSLEDLKQRDHRKLVVVDNSLALIGGRNLSREYYTGFDEVALTPRSLWREVPWLDAGARVEGPAVAALERSFLEAWTEAGGAAFDVADVSPVGSTPARAVIHRGLRDARTLEAYLALIETASSHLYVVNGFPLILEIQHALLRAVRRGVRVRALFGQLTPTHAGQPFGGPWSSARTAATSLVHSRMDAVIAAGGEGYQLSVPEQPAWDPGIGAVRSQVHAKVMIADGRVCAVGSANMDITAGYWESELLLVVEDAGIAGALESRVDQLIADSVRVDRNDLEWQRLVKWREWMRYWPGVLSI
jgi:phosphatidylserine/phosphatidylglycerophosphate/cardiolipin synthase-like enzyme